MNFDELFEGSLYAALVEPLQGGMFRAVLERVPPGGSLLDACCGAGGLAVRAAAHCERVVGVDYSARQIAFARRRVRGRRQLRHVTFLNRDASALREFGHDEFDFAAVTFALHEMPPAARVPVLRELARVAKRVVALDFAAPLPVSAPGIAARFVEFGAGPRHFRAFLDYQRSGGLDTLVAAAGLRCQARFFGIRTPPHARFGPTLRNPSSSWV